MSDPKPTACSSPTDDAADHGVSKCGIISIFLGVITLIAVVLIALMFLAHRGINDERNYQGRAMQTAADWVAVLINMNVDNIDTSLATLHEQTTGELKEDFAAVITPYRDVMTTLQARTTGRIDSVSLAHNDTDAPVVSAQVSERTDAVLVIATSVSANSDRPPTIVRWNLRLEISEMDGSPMVSRLESLK